MDRQRPTDRDVRRPPLVVESRRLLAVSTVDEQERQRRGPAGGDDRRATDDRQHRCLESGIVDRGTEERQRVHLADPRVDHFAVVVIPSRLVLLRAPVVVDGEHDGAGLLGGVAQPDRRATAVRADLEHRLPRNRSRRGDGGVPQCIALVGRHEAFGAQRQGAPFGASARRSVRSGSGPERTGRWVARIHQLSQWMIVSGSGRIAGLNSVPIV